MDYQELISCLITTSPIPSHPSTAIIEETILSIRYHLPKCPIGILCDGVRPELEHRREDYEEYKRRLDTLVYPDAMITPMTSPIWRHQVGLLRQVMPFVARPLLLVCEHDTPLTELPIDFRGISLAILSDVVDLVRFLPEPDIHPEHKHLMLEEIDPYGVRLTKTVLLTAYRVRKPEAEAWPQTA